jgi:hypothetical protein
MKVKVKSIILFFIFSVSFFSIMGFVTMTHNVLRAGDRNPVLRLRQGYGACTLLGAVIFIWFIY